MSILRYIEKIKQENEGPRITAQEPRTLMAKADIPDAFNPDLEQTEVLRPGETLETWEPNPFLKPHAEGGRIGYEDAGPVKPIITKDKFIELRIKHKNTHTNAEFAELLNKDWNHLRLILLIKIMFIKEWKVIKQISLKILITKVRKQIWLSQKRR